MRELVAKIEEALTMAQRFNIEGGGGGDIKRSRELSLAITKLEEAKHWLEASRVTA